MQQAEASVVSQKSHGTWRKEISRCNKPRLRGLGPGLPGGLGLIFRRSEKCPGRRQAKGWETAETAAAEVGAWREAGTGYPPLPPHPRKEEGFHPLTETIQHSPQGRRT